MSVKEELPSPGDDLGFVPKADVPIGDQNVRLVPRADVRLRTCIAL
jgi:hypothetical protein